MNKTYAAVVGGANMDVLGQADGKLVNNDSSPGKVSTSAGGVARNIAENLSRLGNRVEFVGVVGDDAYGKQLLAACRQAGMGVEHCAVLPGESTSTYLAIHNTAGEMQLAINHMSLVDALDDKLLGKRSALLECAKIIVLDANLSPTALEYLFETHADKTFFVDPVSTHKAKKLQGFLHRIHTLKPNLAEVEVLSGMAIKNEGCLPGVAAKLHQQGVHNLLISLGSEGVYASSDGRGEKIEAGQLPVNTVNESDKGNVTGAGDALMAGLAHGYLQQWNWQKSVRFALAAARLALQSGATIHPKMSATEVEKVQQIQKTQ